MNLYVKIQNWIYRHSPKCRSVIMVNPENHKEFFICLATLEINKKSEIRIFDKHYTIYQNHTGHIVFSENHSWSSAEN